MGEYRVKYEAMVKGNVLVKANSGKEAEEKVQTFRQLERRDVDDIRVTSVVRER